MEGNLNKTKNQTNAKPKQTKSISLRDAIFGKKQKQKTHKHNY